MNKIKFGDKPITNIIMTGDKGPEPYVAYSSRMTNHGDELRVILVGSKEDCQTKLSQMDTDDNLKYGVCLKSSFLRKGDGKEAWKAYEETIQKRLGRKMNAVNFSNKDKVLVCLDKVIDILENKIQFDASGSFADLNNINKYNAIVYTETASGNWHYSEKFNKSYYADVALAATLDDAKDWCNTYNKWHELDSITESDTDTEVKLDELGDRLDNLENSGKIEYIKRYDVDCSNFDEFKTKWNESK